MGFLAGVAPARPQLRTALRPQKNSAPRACAPPTHPYRPGEERASGKFSGEFGQSSLALPPVGSGLKNGSFVVRPLPFLTPAPPRRPWSLSVFCQKPLSNSFRRSVSGWPVRRVLAVVCSCEPTLRRHHLQSSPPQHVPRPSPPPPLALAVRFSLSLIPPSTAPPDKELLKAPELKRLARRLAPPLERGAR
jgi:hypothetical protein